MKISELLEHKKEIRTSHKKAIKGMTTWDEFDNNNSPYKALRFGMLCAGSPDFDASEHTEGPIGGKMTTLTYSSADEEILNAAGKKMGVKGKRETQNSSTEGDDVHHTSPVANWNKTTKSKK